jgi:hypothetical protein
MQEAVEHRLWGGSADPAVGVNNSDYPAHRTVAFATCAVAAVCAFKYVYSMIFKWGMDQGQETSAMSVCAIKAMGHGKPILRGHDECRNQVLQVSRLFRMNQRAVVERLQSIRFRLVRNSAFLPMNETDRKLAR